jgi:multidrug efflux pump subunit AcrA (membrane-fusion protein)
LVLKVNFEENDRVNAGQLIAEIDPAPRQREVDLASSKVAVAVEKLRFAEATLERLQREYPRKVAAAEQDLAVAQALAKEAQTRLDVTRIRTDKAVKEAEANVDAAKAVLVKAKEDNDRYQKLFEEKSVTQIKAEEAARSYGTAKAEHIAMLARLESARAELGQVRIAEREVEANCQGVEKATQMLELAKLIRLQIDEAKVEVATRTAEVEQSKRAAEIFDAERKTIEANRPPAADVSQWIQQQIAPCSLRPSDLPDQSKHQIDGWVNANARVWATQAVIGWFAVVAVVGAVLSLFLRPLPPDAPAPFGGSTGRGGGNTFGGSGGGAGPSNSTSRTPVANSMRASAINKAYRASFAFCSARVSAV